MAYKLKITERASELLDNLVFYLLTQFKSNQSAAHLLEGVSSIYNRLEECPFQFPECEDFFLKRREYRKAKIPELSYVMIFRVEEDSQIVYVMGIFHELEDYKGKL